MRWFGKFVATLFLVCSGTLFYLWHHEQKANRTLIDKIKVELSTDRSAAAQALDTPLPASSGWSQVHSAIRNTVPQIVVHAAEFNWLEPYKTPKQRGSTGTGFFIDESGLIITNAHVVDQYRVAYIQIPHFGKRRFDVEVIGVSPERDLALLKVDQDDLRVIVAELGKLPVLQFGDSDTIHRADEIMALGYPLGQDSLKSTVGVVSGRQHMEGRSLIQIDAPINPGNSGGPALNKQGQVVGVNSSGIFGGGTQNVGYVIPSNEVKLFLKQLEDMPEEGGVKFLRKPFLGVLYNTASETVAEFLGNPKPGGQYVVEVYRGSPLDKAGVKAGDMLYEIDGHQIDYFGEIRVRWSEDKVSVVDYVSRLTPGDKIHLVVYRNGIRKELVAEFDFSKMAAVRSRFPGYEQIDYEVAGGLVVMELALNHLPILVKLNAQLTRYVELESQMEPSLIITHVLPDSAAARSRVLHSAMVIKNINGKPTKTIADFRNNMEESLNTGFVTIETTGKVFTVLPFAKIVNEEPKLAANYFYQVSPFMKNIIKQVGTIA